MMKKVRSLCRSVREFQEDESGMEAIQVVAIVALAALVLIFVKTVLWPMIEKWAKKKTSELVD
jgi:hypothetical protein